MPQMIVGFLLLFSKIILLVVLVPGCSGKEQRTSEKSTLRDTDQPAAPPVKPPSAGTGKPKKLPGKNSAEGRSKSKESKETPKPPTDDQYVVVQRNLLNPPPLSAPPEKTAGKKSSKSKKAEGQKKEEPPKLEATQASGDKEPEAKTEAKTEVLGPQSKISQCPNEFEKAAAADGLVVDPIKVKRMGVIDDIVEQQKEEKLKELEKMENGSKDDAKDSSVGAKDKVKIREDKCLMFETNDALTLDEGEDENAEDPI